MALTTAQKTDVRRFAGYKAAGSSTATGYLPPIYIEQALGGSDLAGVLPGMTLDFRLNNLDPSEEAVLTTVYLANLTILEAGILTSTDNMDTDSAGPWKSNPRERQDREAIFNSWRRKMCNFVGVAPGPDLGNGTIAVLRA